jgi:hypothetical protein
MKAFILSIAVLLAVALSAAYIFEGFVSSPVDEKFQSPNVRQ